MLLLVSFLHLLSLCRSQTVTIKHSLVPVSKFLSAARNNPEHLHTSAQVRISCCQRHVVLRLRT